MTERPGLGRGKRRGEAPVPVFGDNADEKNTSTPGVFPKECGLP